MYSGLVDAITNDDDLSKIGQQIILPPTYHGSPRWYNEMFQNAMAVVRHYGKPNLFLTFTATSSWPEIAESLNPGESSYDRPDIVCRVFKMRLRKLMDDLIHGHILGRVKSWLYVIEFQAWHFI